jgi:hypothetical protein
VGPLRIKMRHQHVLSDYADGVAAKQNRSNSSVYRRNFRISWLNGPYGIEVKSEHLNCLHLIVIFSRDHYIFRLVTYP